MVISSEGREDQRNQYGRWWSRTHVHKPIFTEIVLDGHYFSEEYVHMKPSIPEAKALNQGAPNAYCMYRFRPSIKESYHLVRFVATVDCTLADQNGELRNMSVVGPLRSTCLQRTAMKTQATLMYGLNLSPILALFQKMPLTLHDVLD